MLSDIKIYSKVLKIVKCGIGGRNDRSMEQNRRTETSPNVCNN